jgi:hypothetical protein
MSNDPAEKKCVYCEGSGKAHAPAPDDIRALHNALVSKHQTFNLLLWQSPVISFTAQAFLLTIAFNEQGNSFYRVISGLIATLIGLISWQLFVRHSAFEKQSSRDLECLEETYFKKTFHSHRSPKAGFVGRKASRDLWKPALFIVSLAGLFPIIEMVFKIFCLYIRFIITHPNICI